MLRRFWEHVSVMAEATARIAQEYRDIEKVRADGVAWFDGAVYMWPLVKSDGRRVLDALTAIQARKQIPAGHRADATLVSSRDAVTIYARVGGSSAESAMQVLTTIARRALDDAGLTIDGILVEVERAASTTKGDRADER
jgi:hypothetical protein